MTKSHIGMACRDLDASTQFFRDCGFDVAFIDPDARCACFENAGFEVNLFQNVSHPGYRRSGEPLHIGFQIEELKILVEIQAFLSSRYPEVSAIKDRDDGDIFFALPSPDGLFIEFFSRPPSSQTAALRQFG